MLSPQLLAVETLRRIAFEAGCTLLGHAEPDTLSRCIIRYNRLCAWLRAHDSALAAPCGCLPETASAACVRIAARALAARLAADRPARTTNRIAA